MRPRPRRDDLRPSSQRSPPSSIIDALIKIDNSESISNSLKEGEKHFSLRSIGSALCKRTEDDGIENVSLIMKIHQSPKRHRLAMVDDISARSASAALWKGNPK